MSTNDTVNAALLEACRTGDLSAVHAAIAQGASVNISRTLPSAPDSDVAWTPLFVAVAHRQRAVIDALVELGADLNSGELVYGEEDVLPSPVALAAANADLPTLDVLLSHGADPNAQRGTISALVAAARFGSAQCVQRLLQAGALPSMAATYADRWRVSPLHAALTRPDNAGAPIVALFLVPGFAPQYDELLAGVLGPDSALACQLIDAALEHGDEETKAAVGAIAARARSQERRPEQTRHRVPISISPLSVVLQTIQIQITKRALYKYSPFPLLCN